MYRVATMRKALLLLLFAGQAAVANAVYDAIGVRITTLPLTAEVVLRAIREKEGRPL